MKFFTRCAQNQYFIFTDYASKNKSEAAPKVSSLRKILKKALMYPLDKKQEKR